MLSSGLPYDDNTNKAIFVNGHMAFSYTGLAFMDNGKTRNDDWFLDALGTIHGQYPNASFTTIAEHIAERASEAVSRINAPLNLKRLAYVGVGWARLVGEDEFRPIYTIISNAHSQSGSWLPEAQSKFVVLPFTLPDDESVMLVADGQPLDNELRKRVLRQLQSCVQKELSPKAIARILVATARYVAARNTMVGRNLLVNSIPKDSVRVRSARLVGNYPMKNSATFAYVPENKSIHIQYGPHTFAYGVSMKDMVVHQMPNYSQLANRSGETVRGGRL
jgi:hypothetical protein